MTLPLDPDDPWGATRRARMEQVISGERSVYNDYFARLSRWLVEVRRAVITDVRVDPTGVFRFVPQWLREMTDFTATTLLELVGEAYRTIYGPGYRYSQKPFVVEYLGQARNRLVNTPNEVYDVVVGQVTQGAIVGESLPKIAARVELALDANAVPTWQDRAMTVARTETGGALNAGRTAAFQQVADDLGEPFEQLWLATADTRTRPTHRAADLQRVPVGGLFVVGESRLRFPGDPTGPAKEVINCVPGDTLVSFPGLRAVTRRRYEGDLVKLSFATGEQLSATPNHPILRADGVWTPAALLNEGDHCIRALGRGVDPGTPDKDGGPAEISKVYRAAQVAGNAERVGGVPPDFHGDGADGEVEIVAIDGGLGLHREAASDEEVEQFGLALADLARSPRGPHNCSLAGGGLAHSEGGNIDGGAVGGDDAHAPPCVRAQPSGTDPVCLSVVAQLNACFPQAAGHAVPIEADAAGDRGDALSPRIACGDADNVDFDSVGNRLLVGAHGHPRVPQAAIEGRQGDARLACEGHAALPGFISLTQIVKVERVAFTGHVYNLDTGAGWYGADSVIVRNCRCTTLLVAPGESVDLSNRQFEDL